MRAPAPPADLPTLAAHVAWWGERHPAREAAVLDGRRISYGALAAKVDDLSRALLAAGVGHGDRVATLATPSPDFLVAYLAASSIGAIWVGFNPKYRRAELLHVCTDAAPRLLLTRTEIDGRRYDDDLAALRAACPDLAEIVVVGGDSVPDGATPLADFLNRGEAAGDEQLSAARARVSGGDVATIVYTSGSTGRPKGAMLSHGGIVAFARGQNRVWPIEPLRTLNYFPINHVGCLNDITAPTLLTGGAIVFLERFDAAVSLRLMAAERVSLWASVPSVFQMQLALPDFARYDLSAVRLIVWEGAAMARETITRLRDVCPHLATNYGMTETTSAVTVLDPTGDLELLTGSVGGAFPGVELRLAGPDGSPVVDGEAGEVQARSPLNLVGYWNDPEATAAAMTEDGFFRTGDLALRRPDGRFRIVGRLKEMFKSGGYNVYPREVEDAIEAHPAVIAAAVVGVPDPRWDEVGVAFVQASAEVEPEALDTWCRERLANYKVPKRFQFVGELPLLPIGKVDRAALRAREHATEKGDA